MRRFGTALASATILTAVISAQQGAPAPPLLSPGPEAARFPRNLEEFDQMFNQIKNWGRSAGRLSGEPITEARRRHATAKSGITVSLAHPPIKEPAPDNPNLFNQYEPGPDHRHLARYHGYAHSHMRCATSSTRIRPTTARERRHRQGLHAGCRQPGRRGRHAVLIDIPA